MHKLEIQAEILTDVNSRGKERPWKERKDQSLNVSKVLEWGDAFDLSVDYANHFSFPEMLKAYDQYRELRGWLGKKSDNVYNCGETLEFAADGEGNKRLFQAWFCKDRLCPMCNWRRSVKLRGQVLKILETMTARKIEGIPIFVTFTMPNTKADGISKSFSDFAKGFHHLMNYKKVKKAVIGAIRVSEITYNEKRDDYHVHIHCLVLVTPDYFAGRNYISQAEWTALWERAVKWVPADHINPQNGKPTHLVVHVERVKPKDYDKPLEITEGEQSNGENLTQMKYIGAILELTKYTTKPTALPYLDFPLENLDEITDKYKEKAGARMSALERGLYRKRLIGFFGIFRKLHKELDLDDTEDGDLIGADENADGTAIEIVRYTYNYTKKNYYFTGKGNIDQNGYIHYEEDE